jgi:hypothetical protein
VWLSRSAHSTLYPVGAVDSLAAKSGYRRKVNCFDRQYSETRNPMGKNPNADICTQIGAELSSITQAGLLALTRLKPE